MTTPLVQKWKTEAVRLQRLAYELRANGAATAEDFERSYKLEASAEVMRECADELALTAEALAGSKGDSEPVGFTYEACGAVHIQWAHSPNTDYHGLPAGVNIYTTPTRAKGDGDREFYGRLVRMEWMDWAREQPNPKPSWLTPWDELTEPEREVDRRIGERIVNTSIIRYDASRPVGGDGVATDAEGNAYYQAIIDIGKGIQALALSMGWDTDSSAYEVSRYVESFPVPEKYWKGAHLAYKQQTTPPAQVDTTAGDGMGSTFMGLKVVIDEKMAPGVVMFRDADGKAAGFILAATAQDGEKT